MYKSIDDIGVNIELLNQVDTASLARSQTLVEEDKNDRQCKIHPTKILDMFCLEENIAICSLCMKDHRGHTFIDEEEKIERDRLIEIEIQIQIQIER